MQINSVAPGGSAVTLTTSGAAVRSWQVGEILSATVLTPVSNGSVGLRIQDALVQAETRLALAPGETVRLEVVHAGERPILKVVDADAMQQVLGQALRAALPRQTALPPLLANLASLARDPGSGTSLPAAASASAAAVHANLPTPAMVADAAGLKQALLDSGIFLEAKLARAVATDTPVALTGDLKAGLLRLFTALSGHDGTMVPTPASDVPPPMRGAAPQPQAAPTATLAELPPARVGGELLQQVEGALARIQLSQLASVPTDTTAAPMWTLELPVRNEPRTDTWHLRFTQERRGGDIANPDIWSVALAFDLEGLGPVRAFVSVIGEQVSTALWAEENSTVALFDRHLEELRESFHAAGLVVGRVDCRHGAPAEAQPAGTGTRLLDVEA